MQWETELITIENIFRRLDLEVRIKWGSNIYYHNNEMVLAAGGFKNYFSIWFYKGVFMQDPQQKLINAQEGKTKGLRQWRFTSAEDIDIALIEQYVEEAIEIAKQKRSLPKEKPQPITVELFNNRLKEDAQLNATFNSLAPYKQKEYLQHFKDTKRETTQINRINKAIPLILQGIGLHDKYKK